MKSELELALKELAQFVITGEENIKQKYQKEEIPQLNPNEKNARNTYEEFKKIETRNQWKMQSNEIFYKQAKFAENYEDDYEDEKTDNLYYNFRMTRNYSGFTFNDFRVYFSWRTKIRNGMFPIIEVYYQQIYINELLNKIGCKDAQDSINKLIEFWKGYRNSTIKYDNVMPNIIKEFYLINKIEQPYEEIIKKYPIKIKNLSQDIKDIKKENYANKFQFFNDTTSYKITKSKFLETEYAYTLNETVEKVFSKLNEILKQQEISLPDILVRKIQTEYWWKPLRGYDVFAADNQSRTIIIEGIEKYECKEGNWNRTSYATQYKYSNTFGAILKIIEYYTREYLGYRKLKLPDLKAEIAQDLDINYFTREEKDVLTQINKMQINEIISAEIQQYFKDKRIPKLALKKQKAKNKKIKEEIFDQPEKIEVVFNKDQFEKIRKKSEEIQKALIIEETENIENEQEQANYNKNTKQNKKEQKSTLVETAENIIEDSTLNCETKSEYQTKQNIYQRFISDLTPTEKQAIHILLTKQNIENQMLKLAQTKNQMLEVMVSNINDKALETIGDTIISSDMTEIYEDYRNEIKQVL